MSITQISQILYDWNFWNKDLDAGILRLNYLNRIKKFWESSQIIDITGPRRSGKSTIMRQAAKQLIDSGISKNEILMINFEDPRFENTDVSLLEKIFQIYLSQQKPVSKPYIFLDEVQIVNKWEKWVRMIHELDKAKIVVSGSNSQLLASEFGTVLTGRHISLTVLPLSFNEFLQFKKVHPKDSVNQQIEIIKYLETGGFPEVVLRSSDPQPILLEYFQDLIRKDLLDHFQIRKSTEIFSLAKFYMSNISNLTTATSLSKTFTATSQTILRFTSMLQAAYLIFILPRFSWSTKKQHNSPRKIYAVDTGLANAVGFRFSQNIGKIAENAVFLQLLRSNNQELFYWRNDIGEEVDFVVKQGTQIKNLVQVCWNIEDFSTKKREIKALICAMHHLNVNQGLIITGEYDNQEIHKNKVINFISIAKWLLANQ